MKLRVLAAAGAVAMVASLSACGHMNMETTSASGASRYAPDPQRGGYPPSQTGAGGQFNRGGMAQQPDTMGEPGR